MLERDFSPKQGDKFYYPRGLARVVEYSRGGITETDSEVLVKPRTVVEVADIDKRYVWLKADSNRLKGPTYGFYAQQTRVSREDAQLATARRVITTDEIADKEAPRYLAWREYQDSLRTPEPAAMPTLVKEVVIGPTIPGEPITLPAEATIVELPTTANSLPLAAD